MFIDTLFCVDLMRERKRNQTGPAIIKLKELGRAEIFSSIFVFCELQAGARMSKNIDEELKRVNTLFELVTIVYPDKYFAVAYGEVEAELWKKGMPIPTMDLLIGVTAKIHGLPLITRDKTHFQKIEGLLIEVY